MTSGTARCAPWTPPACRQSVAMQLMGLRTENVALRHRVVIQSDLDSGAQRPAHSTRRCRKVNEH